MQDAQDKTEDEAPAPPNDKMSRRSSPASQRRDTAAMDLDEEEETPTFQSVAIMTAAPTLFGPADDDDAATKTTTAVPVTKKKLTPAIARTNSLKDTPVLSLQEQEHGWTQPVLTDQCSFSFVEPFHKHLAASSLGPLLQFLPQLFCHLSLHVTEYRNSPIVARAVSLEQVGLCVSVVRDVGSNNNLLLLQVQRHAGCGISFGKYAREIMKQVDTFVSANAADGTGTGSGESSTTTTTTKVLLSPSFKCIPPFCAGMAQSVLDRCNFLQEHHHHHFDNLHQQETTVLNDTSAMLQCFATRYLALEALTILTDPTRTTKRAAEQVSRALLYGDCGTDDDDGAAVDSKSLATLVKIVVRLAVSGEWDDDDDAMADGEESEVDSRAQYMALQALVNAMHIVDCCSHQSMSVFNKACLSHTGREWIHVLCEHLQAAQHQPHAAYLAAKALCRLHEKQQMSEVTAPPPASAVDPAAAHYAMRCPHAALQAASQQLLYHLGR